MPTGVMPSYQKTQTQVGHQYSSSKHVVQQISSRKSSKSTKKEQVEATEVMAEPAYTVPAFRERAPEGMEEYQRVSTRLGRNLTTLQEELHSMRTATHEQVISIEITNEVRALKYIRRELPIEIPKPPDFLLGLRSHTVWEKTPVKLFCTVSGTPTPIVQWYKSGVPVNPLSAPGKYKIENKYGVHSLIISRCSIADSAVYSAVATSSQGKVTSKATVCVRRPSAAAESSYLPGLAPLPSDIQRSKLEVTFLDRFGVTFGTEGESLTLVANMVVVPDLPNLPPEVMWYRDETLLAPSRWAEMHVGGGAAKLTLPHLNKDDEGLYTVRVWTKTGTTEHSAYLFVTDAKPSVAGAPGAPMDVTVSDANKDYVMVAWKPPNTTNEPLITGYFVDRRKSGTKDWVQCNTTPVKLCKLAVQGLTEGESYHFRVRAVNSAGISLPSRMSSGVTAADVECDVQGVPSAPGKVIASRNTKTSAFVQWEPPKQGKNLMGYYVDCCVVGTKAWSPCNHRPYKHTRFVVHGLTAGDTYLFRVQAVNAYGLSDESQESDPLFIDAALAVPSTPYGISLLSCDGASMTLTWKRPKHTGGSKITSYYLDKREADSVLWKEVSSSPAASRVYKVENLNSGTFYEFKVQAANMAGVGLPSDPSVPFACEAWTMPEPGPSYDISFWEIRDDSLLVRWKAPVYTGAGPVTGYYLEMAKKGSSEFAAVNAEAVNHCYLRVTGLETGASYVFKVCAVNASGKGKASDVSETVCVKALPGTKEIVCGVDEETGDVFLSFEACEASELSKFNWSKSYKEISESKRVTASAVGRTSKLTFVNPEKEDLGLYSVAVTETEGVSSSYTLKEEELKKLLDLSYNIRHPIVPLKTELSYEVLEKGHVRFWLQAKKLSSAASYRFVVNDKEITSSEGHKISHNASTGVIQMVIEHFTRANEGTYTLQITDGKAKNQSSLVLVGDVFKAALKEADFQRKEYQRKLGAHFSEYLSFHVDEDCTVKLVCKLANVKKETKFTWFKEDEEITLDVAPNPMSGSCALPIPLFSRKDQGIYKAVLSDDRGKDTSVYDISGQIFDDIINAIARVSGSSASELMLQCTPEGIRLQCYMKYYTEEMKTSWFHKDSKIASSEKMRIGGTSEMAWMQICEPADREKGQYTIEIHDGKSAHTRSFDLSGQAYNDAYAEFQRLKAAAFAEKNRGRVMGGLPDVVTIMEYKTLNLTCTVWGDPKPEVTWFKNEQEVVSDDHNQISFESGKFASLTVKTVTVEDSGKYSINVRNKYGGEFVEITVSVYKQGEDIPEPKLGQMAKPAAAQRPSSKPQTPAPSVKSPTPSPAPSVKTPTPTPPPSVKTPTPAPKSPTPPRSAKSPTPPRFMRSPTPTKK